LKITSIIITVIFLGALTMIGGASEIPVTGQNPSQTGNGEVETTIPSLSQFADQVKNGSDQVRGVYLDKTLALEVVQQPENQAVYISSDPGEATQFKMASSYGSIGLLAHNYAGGADFQKVETGDRILLLYGNGSVEVFKVTSVLEYQALNPNSASSDFVDLATGTVFSAKELFMKVYSGKPHLTLQTCISADGQDSWGRLFVIAEQMTGGNNKELVCKVFVKY
jgi:hypothetical protein